MKTPSRKVFDPAVGIVVSEHETSSTRIRAKLRDSYSWCFCELCGRQTEHAFTKDARAVYKDVGCRNYEAVPLTDSVRDESQRQADLLTNRYEKALAGQCSIDEASELRMAFCNIIEMRGDWSVESFRDQVERGSLIAGWARRGDLLSVARLPKQLEGSAKPSKLYCELHNPRRSIEARRAYQRDRKFSAEYSELISVFWGIVAGYMPAWDIQTHVYVRNAAYSQLQRMKSPTRLIHELQVNGVTIQSEIARQLRVSRQAVSAAIKRQAPKRNSV